MFNKEKSKCPICEGETNFFTKGALKYNNEYLCQSCVQKLGRSHIGIFNIKKYSLEELKEKAEMAGNEEPAKISEPKNKLECPHCKGHNIELLSNDKNYKTKYKTTINLNPFKPFTLTNSKEIKKETAKEHNEYLCKDCGNRWIGK
jgi:transposase-like protein